MHRNDSRKQLGLARFFVSAYGPRIGRLSVINFGSKLALLDASFSQACSNLLCYLVVARRAPSYSPSARLVGFKD